MHPCVVSSVDLLKRGLVSGLISYHQLFVAQRRTGILATVIRRTAQKTTSQRFFKRRHSTLIVSAWLPLSFDRKFVMSRSHGVARSHGLAQQVEIDQGKYKREHSKWNKSLSGRHATVKHSRGKPVADV